MAGGPGAAAAPRVAAAADDAAAWREPCAAAPAPADGMAPAPAPELAASASSSARRKGAAKSRRVASAAVCKHACATWAAGGGLVGARRAHSPAESSLSTGEKKPPQPLLASSSCLRRGVGTHAKGDQRRAAIAKARSRKCARVVDAGRLARRRGRKQRSARDASADAAASHAPLHRFFRHAHRRQRAHGRRGCANGRQRAGVARLASGRRARLRCCARGGALTRRRRPGGGGGGHRQALAIGR